MSLEASALKVITARQARPCRCPASQAITVPTRACRRLTCTRTRAQLRNTASLAWIPMDSPAWPASIVPWEARRRSDALPAPSSRYPARSSRTASSARQDRTVALLVSHESAVNAIRATPAEQAAKPRIPALTCASPDSSARVAQIPLHHVPTTSTRTSRASPSASVAPLATRAQPRRSRAAILATSASLTTVPPVRGTTFCVQLALTT